MSVPAVLLGMRPLRESSHKTSALALGCNVRHIPATFETPIGPMGAKLEHPFGPERGRTVTGPACNQVRLGGRGAAPTVPPVNDRPGHSVPDGVPDGPSDGVGGVAADGPARLAVLVIALLEAAACLVFGVMVLVEAGLSDAEPPGAGGAVVGVTALLAGAGLVVVGVILGRGGRRTAGVFGVTQALIALIGLSQVAAGVAAGRWLFAAAWVAVVVVAGGALWALVRVVRHWGR